MICPFRLSSGDRSFGCIHFLPSISRGTIARRPELNVPVAASTTASSRQELQASTCRIELQTLDTTGTVWPERERFLHQHGIRVKKADGLPRNPSDELGNDGERRFSCSTTTDPDFSNM